MLGKHTIKAVSKNETYLIDIIHKYNVIMGKSATGKSYFYKLVEARNRGVKIECDIPVVAIGEKEQFESYLNKSGNILVIDEFFEVYSELDKYADRMKVSDNYFIFITRQYLTGFQYAISAVYKLKTSNNLVVLTPYFEHVPLNFADTGVIITEDTKVGNEFYRTNFKDFEVFPKKGDQGGNRFVKKHYEQLYKNGVLNNKHVYIIVDGAAFGNEIMELYGVIKMHSLNIKDFLIAVPESFEQLVCAAKLGIDDDHIKNPFDYDDTMKYSSWERYFTVLANKTVKGYNKKWLTKAVIELSDKIIVMLKHLG